MTVGDLLDGAFTVLTRRPRTLVAIAAVVVVPVQVLAAYASRASLPTADVFARLSTAGTDAGLGEIDLLLTVLATLLDNLALFFLGGAVAALVTAWYGGGDLDARGALAAALRRSGALVGAWALLLPVKLLAALPCYLGLVFVTPIFAVTAPAIVVEGLGPVAGAKRSWQLVTRRLFPTIGVVLLVTLVISLLEQILVVPPLLVSLALPSSVAWIAVAVGGSAVALLTQTALVAASVLLYVDLRVRTEGLDLELGAVEAFAGRG
jgi:hypothetical protein